MKISLTYANRPDLTLSDKWLFTLHDRIRTAKSARAVWDYFYGDLDRNEWQRSILEGTVFVCCIPFLLIMGFSVWIDDCLFNEQCGSWVAVVLSFFITMAFSVFVPYGWLIWPPTIWFLVWHQFILIMPDSATHAAQR